MKTEQVETALEFADRLGVRASVVMDRETHGPRVLRGAGETPGLRSLEDELEKGTNDLVDEINVVTIWSFHVALYALQNPTPENIDRALSMIGTSGSCEECIDWETLRPMPAPPPHGWDDPLHAATQPEPPMKGSE